MNRCFIAAAALLALSGAAFAADLPTRKAPEPLPVVAAPTWDWTGAYAGVNLGVSWRAGTSNVYTTNGAFLASDSVNSNGEFRGGGQMGYRYQLPSHVVLGAQFTGDFDPGRSQTAGQGANQGSMKSSGLFAGSAAAQFGYAFGDLLPYVLGGVALEGSDLTLTIPAANYSETASAFRAGWLIGGGLDYHVFGNWTVSAQYQYASFNAYRLNFPVGGGYFQNTDHTQTVLVGVNYKF